MCLCLGGGERPEPWAGGNTASQRSPPTRSISLHHRIRQASNPYATEMKAFDARLQKGEVFSKEDLNS